MSTLAKEYNVMQNTANELSTPASKNAKCKHTKLYTYALIWSRGVIVKAMDCEIVVSEFVLQSRYYVHFWTNTLGEGMKHLILPAMD